MRLLPILTLLLLALPATAEDRPAFRDRWLYQSVNLLVEENVDNLEPVWRRAAAAGYTGVLLSDSKFGRLASLPDRYFAHVRRVRDLASELGLEIVPCVFQVGYSESHLSQDPNLAEGLPVRGARCVVRDGVAHLSPDPAVSLRGADFADLALWDWKDACVTADDGAALMRDPNGGNARIVQTLAVSPFRCYHLSVRVRTRDFLGEPRVAVLADGDISLNHASLGVAPTQDWTTHHVVFNSLEQRSVRIYLGAWGASTGSLWWDDALLEECGPVNLLRRPGAPFTLKRDDGTLLVEGRDYEPVSDPRSGTVPWPGGFEVWHDPPAIRTALPDGTVLRASWYHAVTVHAGQVTICPSEPKTLEVLRDHMKRVHAAFGAKRYFMSHDEIRVLNWCEACAGRKLTAGEILADSVRACAAIAREEAPGCGLLVWSDMFDPGHNARAGYYLVRGDLAGSWEGLDKEITVACWHHGGRNESLRFFAARGHATLIAGYYDDDLARLDEWLEAARGVPRVTGLMYTTWRNDYQNLEPFARRAWPR